MNADGEGLCTRGAVGGPRAIFCSSRLPEMAISEWGGGARQFHE